MLPLAARLARPALAVLDPERAHLASMALLAVASRTRLVAGRRTGHDPRLATRVLGLDFPTPIGLAAGFDKDGRAAACWGALGFGFAEIGTVTPRPQTGNPRPRLFRLPDERATINRMGFNNQGIEACLRRLRGARARGDLAIPLGLNLGINKDDADPEHDYASLAEAGSTVADYLVLNVSSPNTPRLRDLQDEARLDAILRAAVPRARVPLLVKLAPDLADEAVAPLVRLAVAHGVAGLIVSNTTVARPPGLGGTHRGERGGLSGRPLAGRARAMLALAAAARAETGADLALVSCGGIETGAEILRRLQAGADLVQLYTAFAYDGPALLARLEADLLETMDRAGVGALPLSGG